MITTCTVVLYFIAKLYSFGLIYYYNDDDNNNNNIIINNDNDDNNINNNTNNNNNNNNNNNTLHFPQKVFLNVARNSIPGSHSSTGVGKPSRTSIIFYL